MIGPPTALEAAYVTALVRINELEQRVEEIGGVLASVRMACQQQFLVYGRKKQRFDARGVSETFKTIRDMAAEDPAGRDKPPDFTRPWRAVPPQMRPQFTTRDMIQRATEVGS